MTDEKKTKKQVQYNFGKKKNILKLMAQKVPSFAAQTTYNDLNDFCIPEVMTIRDMVTQGEFS